MTTTLRHARVGLVLLALIVSALVPLDGRPASARDRFEAARTADEAARSAVERVPPTAPSAQLDVVVRRARRAVANYETLARRFPTSGYTDNALWHAARLSQWLYQRLGRPADRAAAANYYDWLAREYPASPLRAEARSARAALASLAVGRAVTAPAAVRREPAPLPVNGPATSAPAERAAPDVPSTTAGAGGGPNPSHTATLNGIERVVLDKVVRVTLALDRETPFRHELLSGPPRTFVDLIGATVAGPLDGASMRYDGDAVRQVRVGHQDEAVRVVLDLDGARAVSVFTLYNPYRVVVDIERPVSTRATAARVPPPAPVEAVAVIVPPPVRLVDERNVPVTAVTEPPARDEASASDGTAAPLPSVTPRPVATPPVSSPGRRPGRSPLPGPVVTVPVPAPAPPPETAERDDDSADDPAGDVPVPVVPSANADGSFSLGRQLGLGVSRVVIDPGHGGHDPGTVTGGSSESRVVLDVALRLEKLLVKDGIEVVLTRRTDVFIPLEHRTALANREGADLFLSIHANASRDAKARGVEVYYLSFASNPEAEAVAARENATSAGGMHTLPSIVRAIALNNKLDESRDFARMVQQSLTARLSRTNDGLRSRGVKKAPFVVLIGAAMPSVLAEIGFITNRQEAALIKTPAYRQRIAESLHAAVTQYRRALKRQSAVAAR